MYVTTNDLQLICRFIFDFFLKNKIEKKINVKHSNSKSKNQCLKQEKKIDFRNVFEWKNFFGMLEEGFKVCKKVM